MHCCSICLIKSAIQPTYSLLMTENHLNEDIWAGYSVKKRSSKPTLHLAYSKRGKNLPTRDNLGCVRILVQTYQSEPARKQSTVLGQSAAARIFFPSQLYVYKRVWGWECLGYLWLAQYTSNFLAGSLRWVWTRILTCQRSSPTTSIHSYVNDFRDQRI